LIEHDCVMPVVRMHFAMFGAAGAAATWTTAQLADAHAKVFFPPRDAIWTTVCVVLAQVQRLPGQRGPA
jgi:hypothetical protein